MTQPADRMTAALLQETSRLARLLAAERRYYLKWLLALVLLIILGVAGAVFYFRPGAPPDLLIIAGSLALSLPAAQLVNWLYRRSGKRLFVDGMAQTAGLRYDPAGIFPVSAAVRHRILPVYDRDTVEDGFEGAYGGVPVAFQEVRLSGLEQVPGHTSRKREHTAFWGMLIRVKLQRPVEGHTVVIPRTALQTVLRTAFSQFEQVRAPSKFEKKYHIMSTDQIEARVIMDPAFMERFLEAAEIMKARWMEVSFLGDEIMFAVQRFRPLFEVGHIWQPVTAEYMRKLADHIDAVDRMIDALRLNRQVGLG